MKRIMILALAALMMIGGTVRAERLSMRVMDLLSVDAELPEGTPYTLPALDIAPYVFDPDLAQALLMPDCEQRKEQDDPVMGHDVQFGGDGEGEEYMLIELTYGRLMYWSTFWQTRLQGVISIGDEMKDTLNYYPEDREVEGFPRADALSQAENLLSALGIRLGTHVLPEPRVLAIDVASYDVMLEDLTQADAQAYLPRHYLEPYDSAYDGYLILYECALNGVRFLDFHSSRPLALFVSRQGVEYLETEYIYDVVQAGEPQTLLSAERALTTAMPDMERANDEGDYVAGDYRLKYGNPEPSVVTRIRLGYRLSEDRKRALPVWEYTFLRAMWKGEGTWQTRSLDNPAFLGLIHIDAVTGEYIETIQA